MRKNILFVLGIIIAVSFIGIFAYKNKVNTKLNIQETESQLETTEEDLDIKIDNNKMPIAIVIGEDGKVLSESELEEEYSKEAEIIQEQASMAIEEGRETEPISPETLSNEDMQEIEDNIDAHVKQDTINMRRSSAKTNVAILRSEGKTEFANITDAMIDNCSEEELSNLWVLIYKYY